MKNNNTVNEELVCWVNEKGKILQPIPLSLANSDPKYRHLEVAILVLDKEERALLQKRSRQKKVSPNLWITTAAGHVTYGEDIATSATRELREEMGLAGIKLAPLFVEDVSLPNERHFAHWYLGYYNGQPITIQQEEVDDIAWVGSNELDDFVSTHEVSLRTIKVLKAYWSGKLKTLLTA